MHPFDPTDPASASTAQPAWNIEGPLVIATVADWHRRLCAQLEASSLSAIDLAQVEAIDVFGLQLLLAAGRAAAAAGRPLTVVNRPPSFDELCRAAGLAPTLFSAS